MSGKSVSLTNFSTLAYTDDIILLATEAWETEDLIKRLGRYLKRQHMGLNVEKMKVVRIKNKRRAKAQTDKVEMEWERNWGEEEVQVFGEPGTKQQETRSIR